MGRDQRLFKLASRASSRQIELLERSRLELEMPEANPIERVDDLLGNIGDRLGARPLADQELGGAVRRTRSGSRRVRSRS